MGLSLAVGELSNWSGDDLARERAMFKRLNAYLREIDLQPHAEPEELEGWSDEMIGYSGLHYVRRIAAHLADTNRVPPPGDEETYRDEIVERYYTEPAGRLSLFQKLLWKVNPTNPFSHLMVHSDSEGLYLPQRFHSVLCADEAFELPGDGVIGSVPVLLDECLEIARAIELPTDPLPTVDERWEAADNDPAPDAPRWEHYGIESYGCALLIEMCRRSLDTGAALIFQ